MTNTLRLAYLTAKNSMRNGVNSFDAAEAAGQLYGLGYREIIHVWMELEGVQKQ
jgi:hypothetical protein